jgi:hypothetical protein
MNPPEKNDRICKQAFVDIRLAMRVALKEIDRKVDEWVS